jgi:small subunit ribosomal protein S16
MIKIRLSRTGKKRQPSYRVVVADIRAKRDGRVVERIGHFNPLAEPETFAIREDRALHWLSVGAQPSDAVRRLLEKQGTFERLQRFHAGESMEVLLAEYNGEPLEAAAEESAAVEAEVAAEAETEEAAEEEPAEAETEEAAAEPAEEAAA